MTYYLDLEPVPSGKRLTEVLEAHNLIDFDFADATGEAMAALITSLAEFCALDWSAVPITEKIKRIRSADDLIRRAEYMSTLLEYGSFRRQVYDVDDDHGGGLSVLFGQWPEQVLVLRLGAPGFDAGRADVSRLLEGYVSCDDPAVYQLSGRPAEMLFNVMVTGLDNAWEQGVFEWSKDRIFEHTDEEIRARLSSFNNASLTQLASLPTLFMYEQGAEGLARVGSLKRVQTRSGREIRVIFEFDDTVPPLSIEQIADMKWELGLSDFEFSRTHWAVKKGSLYNILRQAGIIAELPAPSVVSEPQRPPEIEAKPAKVFLVHGRDNGRKEALARFVEVRAGIEVVVLHERPNKGRSILQKFEQEAQGANFAIVLMTADDLGKIKPALAQSGDDKEPRSRARQNVVFELGFFIGKLGVDRVCVLIEPGVEKPSDYDGVVYIGLDDNEGWQRQLVTELHSAELPVSANWWKAK